MPITLPRRAASIGAALVVVVLTACSADSITEPGVLMPVGTPTLTQGMAQCTPAQGRASVGAGVVADPVLASRCSAQPGDLVDVALDELIPTQGALGYDEVYYKLGRYRSNKGWSPLTYATRIPSGDHRASEAATSDEGKPRLAPPANGTTQVRVVPRFASTSAVRTAWRIHRPSGESCGSLTPRTAAKSSNVMVRFSCADSGSERARTPRQAR